MLKIFEALAVEEKLFVEVRMGQRGVHWEFDAERGSVSSAALRRPQRCQQASDCVERRWPGRLFRALRGPGPPLPTSTCRRRCCNTASTISAPSGRRRACSGKPDVVPSSIKHLRDLRNLQMTVYAEIVRGERDLDYFDDFVAEWTERGGAEMTQEAREIYKGREEIYRRVGVVQ